MDRDDVLPWIDIETFGLDPMNDPIIEFGFRITNLALEELASFSWVIWSGWHVERHEEIVKDAWRGNKNAQFIWEMHTKNKLFENASCYGIRPEQVEKRVVDWFEGHKLLGLPMCGSSVHFDRKHLLAQMPQVEALFHYRIIDVSALKETCRRYAPKVYDAVPAKVEQHRVDPDLYETVEEFRYYRDNFLKVEK